MLWMEKKGERDGEAFAVCLREVECDLSSCLVCFGQLAACPLGPDGWACPLLLQSKKVALEQLRGPLPGIPCLLSFRLCLEQWMNTIKGKFIFEIESCY